MSTDFHAALQVAEARRRRVQARLDAERPATLKNRLGQFATPPELARELLALARELLPDDKRVRFLDPAFGTGVFYAAFLEKFSPARQASAVGFEIDPELAGIAQSLWSPFGLRLHRTDFLTAPLPDTEVHQATLIVCNPPYVRHHHLDAARKARLQAVAQQRLGIRVSGLAGLYVYFLLVADAWLADDGLALWLIPSEFMDVAYGASLKQYLCQRVSLLRLHRYAPQDTQFADALVTSTVVVYRKRHPAKEQRVHFSFGGRLSAPARSSYVPQEALQEVPKWSALSDNSFQRNLIRRLFRGNDALTIGDLFDIRRGLATGANDYFILQREHAAALGLPEQFLRPVLPSPRYLTDDEILADEMGAPLVSPSLVLLDCDLAEAVVRQRFPTLAAYLAQGEARGLPQRYLLRHRRPWYRQEARPPAPILCSYMARATSGKSGLRFFRNHSLATATNVYLMLYPKQAIQAACEATPGLMDRLWALLRQIGEEELLSAGRVYGGGLNKIEPRELARVRLPNVAWLRDLAIVPKQLALWEM